MSLYFIALLLPKELEAQIHKIKLEIAEKYKAKHALKLPAHATLQIPFRLPETEEDKLIGILKNFVEKEKSFQVDLKDFGRFNQKVIFINIEDHEPIKKLHADLQKILNKNFSLKEHEAFPEIHPHITLATRDLHYKEFTKAWEDFKSRKFIGSFLVDKICLFKHDGKHWHLHKKFNFN